MGKRTIYVREEDESLFDKLAADGNLSAVIARAVKAERGEWVEPTGQPPACEDLSPGQTQTAAEMEEVKPKKPVSVVFLMSIDPVALEVGRGLIPLVDPNKGAPLLEKVTGLRRDLAISIGIVLPGVRFRDNLSLKPNQYRILLRSVAVASGQIEINHNLVLPIDGKLPALNGRTGTDPVTGATGLWITPELSAEAKTAGFHSFDPMSVIMSHLRMVVTDRAPDLVGLQDTDVLLSQVRKTQPAVVNAAVPGVLSLVQLWQLLGALLREKVSIRDLALILETAVLMRETTGTYQLETAVEACRLALRRTICEAYVKADGQLSCLTLAPELEAELRGPRHEEAYGKLVTALHSQSLRVVLTSPELRVGVRDRVLPDFPGAVILSRREVQGMVLDVRAVL